MEEQTSILKTLLEAWMKQEAHNKTLEAEVGLIKQELQAVKEECQAVKDELHAAKEQLDNITAVTTGQGSPHWSYTEVARTLPNSVSANVTLYHLWEPPRPVLLSVLACSEPWISSVRCKTCGFWIVFAGSNGSGCSHA
ncbi:hypothetical protein V500_04954 [Pseudogymnoascus sp. VKM F-4518 (FW-2643)]|nr:hypothetical protein V500_04954 [Pseudogymnoascus sp. VKM F-4518 (FW-2643)]